MYIASIDEYTTIGAAGLGGSSRNRMYGPSHTTEKCPPAAEAMRRTLGTYSALAAVFSGK
jgi:hypothetical protein